MQAQAMPFTALKLGTKTNAKVKKVLKLLKRKKTKMPTDDG